MAAHSGPLSAQQYKQAIEESLRAFADSSLRVAARDFFKTLGYSSDREVDLDPPTAETFEDVFAAGRTFNRSLALVDHWKRVDFLFQLTGDEVQTSLQLSLPFGGKEVFDGAIMESYLFLAIDLKGETYTRTQLAGITRAVNQLFDSPAMLLFRYGEMLTLAIVRRRLGKRDSSRDVLERKVTFIKDIRYADPLRAHIEILYDLSLRALHEEYYFQNFQGLHTAWEKRLDSYALNERFYREIANWYFWAQEHPGVVYPRDVRSEEQRAIFFIRLLTRMIFCWFLREKGLIPRDLFRERVARGLLADFSPVSGSFYRAILQNLFFATLNQKPEERDFRRKYKASGSRDGNRGVTNLFRYRDLFRKTEDQDCAEHFRELVARVPFVNGGLFDCLDQVYRQAEGKSNLRLDDFSEERGNALCLPNELFFGQEQRVDLSAVYEDKRRTRESVRGLVNILDRYKFTVEENTPLEEDIALDPELLGKVFENLLAAYNEDTRTTARKATGSFYTPREVVSYMVDESLLVYLRDRLVERVPEAAGDAEERLRQLFVVQQPDPSLFTPAECEVLVRAIDQVKIIDPACGTGAFLMGALRRLVELLQRLDPTNEEWKRVQRRRAVAESEQAFGLGQQEERRQRLSEIEEVFTQNTSDYGRKLYLIENCVYGVDIQPIACQIAKLRFFIALLVDQRVDPSAPNQGVRALPNLETRIVAANTLIPIEKAQNRQYTLLEPELQPLRQKLEEVRHRYFTARTPEAKAAARKADADLRRQIAGLLQEDGLSDEAAQRLAAWDPYDQNAHADFFDPEWMFGIPVGRILLSGETPATLLGHFGFVNDLGGQLELMERREVESGFDIVLGNPPYVRQEQIKDLKPRLKGNYDAFVSTADLYVYFYERGVRLLKPGGVFAFITSNKWYRAAYGQKLRAWLKANTRVLQLVDFGDAPVFTAIAYPTIVILQRDGTEERDGHTLRALNWRAGAPTDDLAKIIYREAFELPQTALAGDGWRLEGTASRALLEQLRTAGTPLGEYVKGRFYYGIKTGLNEAFIVDGATRDRLIAEHPSSAEVLKPFLRGRDVKRWRVEPQDLWLIFIRRGTDIKKYPAILEHLAPYRERLTPGVPGGRKPGSYKWFEIQDNIAYWREFEQPKILYPDIYEHQSFAWDEQGYFAANTCYFIPTRENWLTGVLNSVPIEWFYSQISARVRGGYLRAFSDKMKQVPIPKADESQRLLLQRVVEYLQYVHAPMRRMGSERFPDPLLVGYFEQLLNGLVYELFFPDDLQKANLTLFKQVEQERLPSLETIPARERAARLHELFERLYDLNHPVRVALFALQSLDVVRIIEGKE